ncbi:MAG: hypothetical protein HY365_03435 [Candidatus Aenigmarchaeota archaeon]|nr:hypothetical protein [Candidatus Aenigmarchaeota archaeon]
MLRYGLVFALLFVSGCTSQIDFGQNEIQVATPVLEEASDIVAIKNIDTIPNSPVLPDDTVDLSFIIENLDKTEPLSRLKVDLFDAASFKDSQSTTLCNTATTAAVCKPEGQTAPCAGNKCDLVNLSPGAQRLVNYNLKAPSSNDILKLSTDFELRFAVEHYFTANSIYRPVVVNPVEIKALQRAGQKVDLQAASTLGSGPVKIDLSLVNRNFILNKRGATFEAVVRHTGSGRLLSNKIEHGALTITFVGIPCNKFDGISAGGYDDAFTFKDDSVNSLSSCVFTNNAERDVKDSAGQVTGKKSIGAIDIYSEGKSNPLLFRLNDDATAAIDIGVAPYRSYEVRATAGYTYRVSGVARVTVKPLEI